MEAVAWSRAKRVALAALMGFVAMNVWTGSPLLALWVASRLQGEGAPQMWPIFAGIVLFLALSLGLVRVLSMLGGAYDRLAGTQPAVREHTPWLRSMRGERERYSGEAPQLTALERVLVVMVVVAAAAFEIWFFFFSGSSIDQRSGRSALPPAEVAAVVASERR